MIFPAHKIFKNYCVSSIHFNFRFIKVTLEKNLRRRKLFHIIMFIRCCKFLVLYKIKMTRFSFLFHIKWNINIYIHLYILSQQRCCQKAIFILRTYIFFILVEFFLYFFFGMFFQRNEKNKLYRNEKFRIKKKERKKRQHIYNIM